jgi:peptidoglycan/LPS O-acetylase OafA/YrhL
VFSRQGLLGKYSFSLGLSWMLLLIAALFFSIKIILLQNILFFINMVCFVSLIIIISVLGRDRDSKSVFSNTLCFLGDASYSIYLTHSFLIGPSARVWSLYFSNELWPLFVLMMLIGASILGSIVHVYIEKRVAFLLKDVRWSFKSNVALK